MIDGPFSVYVRDARCQASCACAGVLQAAECQMEPGCDECWLRLYVRHPAGVEPPGEIMVVHLHPGETTRQAVARHLGEGYASVGSRGWIN